MCVVGANDQCKVPVRSKYMPDAGFKDREDGKLRFLSDRNQRAAEGVCGTLNITHGWDA